MNITFLITTAFVVSIDSFFAGISIPNGISNKKYTILGAVFVIFLTCILGNQVGIILQHNINEKFACIGGVILILVGVYNLLKQPNCNKRLLQTNQSLTQSCIIGLGVGADGCIASLSLAVIGYTKLYVPTLIILFHTILLCLGAYLSKRIKVIANNNSLFAPIALILLGFYKIATML